MSVERFACKTCAAPIGFDIKVAKWKCEYCGSEFEKNEIEQQTGKADGVELNEDLSVEIPELDEYRCNACGAQILTEGETAATFCIYCRSPSIIKSRFSGDFRPRYLIPFKITQTEARQVYFRWIQKRFFAPSEFKNAREVNSIRGLYAPYWLFDCGASGFVIGEGRNTRSWTSGDYRYTETKHYFIKRSGFSQYEKIPVDGSKNLDDELMEGIEPFDYGGLKDFALEFMSGYLAERYDVDQTKAARAMEPRARKYLQTTLEESGQRYDSVTFQSSHISLNNVKAAYAMLPIYVLTNIYQKKKHTFMINGQTGKTYGETPYDKGKLVVFSLVTFLASWVVALIGAVFLEAY